LQALLRIAELEGRSRQEEEDRLNRERAEKILAAKKAAITDQLLRKSVFHVSLSFTMQLLRIQADSHPILN